MPGTPDQTLFLCATDPGVPAHGNLRLLGPLTAQAKRTPRRAQRAARSPRHSHRPAHRLRGRRPWQGRHKQSAQRMVCLAAARHEARPGTYAGHHW